MIEQQPAEPLPATPAAAAAASILRLRGWVRQADALTAEVARLAALTATCCCGTTYATYAGPEPDCPVHGAVRALHEVTAKLAAVESAAAPYADSRETGEEVAEVVDSMWRRIGHLEDLLGQRTLERDAALARLEVDSRSTGHRVACRGCGSPRTVVRGGRRYCTEPTCDRRLPGPPCETCTRPRSLHICLGCTDDELSAGPGCGDCYRTGWNQTPCLPSTGTDRG
jgi:hypothetical protein